MSPISTPWPGCCEGAAVCVNSTQYYFNLDVMRACLKAGVHYLDLGGLFHVTPTAARARPGTFAMPT